MDIRKLKELCEAALPLIDQVDYSKPTPKSLLRALLVKTIEYVDDGVNAAEIMFTTVELVGLVKKVNGDQAKKFKSDHYSETEKLLSKINKLKEQQGYSDSKFILELSDTGEIGGAKNKKHHFIKLVEINKAKSKNETNNATHIHYNAVQLPKPYWFAKPFMSIELSSWRLFLFLALPAFLLFSGVGLFVQSIINPTPSEFIAFLLFIFSVAFIGSSIFPFYVASNLRIAIAPQWLMNLSQVSAQIESIKLSKFRKNGRPYRKLEFVIYEGKCPLCNNVVEIENGKRQFKGRLVGICNESPREHVFSFDHVTKSGAKL
ncbi:MAG: hypothetical protein MJK12_18100 [Colwellia sp.]|nr:hypothetical protein [Colwellia sp.]